MRNSILFNTDSYKVGMWSQYPVGTRNVYSYIEARSDECVNELMVAGVYDFLTYDLVPFTLEDIDLAEKLWTAHGEPFNTEGWKRMFFKYGGKYPLIIRTIPEGTVVPVGVPIVTVENTDPEFYWLTTWIETALLRSVWYASSVATTSFRIKKLIKSFLEETGDTSGLPFKLHDFGARGTTSMETAGRGGLAHLYNFMGTDTFVSILRAQEVFGADPTNVAFSIPAAEHSTITSWGRAGEKGAYRNMLKQFGKPGAIVAVVSDSYNIYEACKIWVELKDEVITSGATIVIRPDSGNPAEVLPKCFDIIAQGYGYTKNAKGFNVLNNIRFIWGDGINEASINRILNTLRMLGWSADNIAFGMGAALLNKVQRDDLGWAMKCSSITMKNGMERNVFKDPITAKSKVSKKGRVVPALFDGKIGTSLEDHVVRGDFGEVLVTAYLNGTILNKPTLATVRALSDMAA